MVVPKSTTAAVSTTTSKKNNKDVVTATTPTETTTKPTTKPTTTKKQQVAEKVVVIEQPVVIEPEQIVKPIYTRPISIDNNLTTTQVIDKEWYNMDIKSGGSFIKIPPILIDSENLLLSNNNTIKIYNPNTGLIKSETSLESTNETITYITSTHTTTLGNTLVYLSSSLGRFYQFNSKQKSIDPIYRSSAESSQNTEELRYKKGIVKFVICPSNVNTIYFLNQDGELCTFNGKTGISKLMTTNNNGVGGILKNLHYISISNNGQYLVIASKSLIQVLNLSNTTVVSSKYYKSEYQITSVSIIPKLTSGAVENLQISFGTTLGRLNFINYNSTSNTITFSSYNHWHSTPLISTQFNIDGTLLFTGGYENSLAIWTVSNMRRKVLPRLGGAIVYINVDPLSKLCAITLSNNKVQVVKISDLKACSIITGLQSPTTSTSVSISNKITSFIDPNSNNLIFSGQKNGIVQFYNIKKDRVENEIIVSPIRNTDISTKKSKGHNLESNFTSDTLSLEQSNVEPLAFHPKKPLFVSFESFSSSSPDKLESKVALKDQILKFWETSSNGAQQRVDCVFSISTPHTSNILSMSFHPTKDILLTTSENDFKIWKKQSMETIDNTTKTVKTYWTCVHEGSYRGLRCTASAFSRDGSVFAVASGHCVVLYSSESMLQLSDQSILTFSTSHIVSELSFLSKNGVSQILVSYKENGAIVWDVASRLPIKVYNFPIKPISVANKYYALCPTSSRNRIMIFDIKSHQLLFTSLVEIPKDQVVDQVLFSKDQQNYDCLLAITNENLIYGYSTYKHTNNISNPTTIIGVGNQVGSGTIKQSIINSTHYNNKRARLNNILNTIKSKDQQDDDSTTITTATNTTTTTTTTDKSDVFIGKEIFTKLPSTQEMFGAASHIMPSVQNIYQKYMDSILINTNNLTENSNNHNNSNNINNNIIINDENIDNNNKSDENNNVKKQPQQQQPQQLNNNKFSSMKNFFENLEEPMDISTTLTPSPVATSVNGSSSSASTKEIKTKSSTSSSSSSSSKKRKGAEN